MKDVRGFLIQSLHEGRDLKDDEEEFNKRIKPYSVLTLENAALRAVLAPELNAQVLYLADKRTGQNLLREADPGSGANRTRAAWACSFFPTTMRVPARPPGKSWPQA